MGILAIVVNLCVEKIAMKVISGCLAISASFSSAAVLLFT